MMIKLVRYPSSLVLALALSWVALFCTHIYAAEEASQSNAAATSITKKKFPKNSSDFNTKISFDMNQQSYMTTSEIDGGSVQQYQMRVNIKKQGSFFSGTDISIGSFSTPNSLYFALSEAYLGWGDKYSSITTGKKIENLSFADTFFNFGLVQPFTTQDHIEYMQGGLTSVAAHFFDGGKGFNLAFNPFFVPNFGPQVKVDDGKVVSASRWAQTPPSYFKFGDEKRDIVYAIRDFKLTDIVTKTGFTANFFVGDNIQRPTFLFTYGQKPVNELALSRDTYSDLATFKGNVILNPVVLNHEFYAADLNLDSGNVKTTLSFLGDHPVNQVAPELESIQTLSPLSIVSAYLGIDLADYFGKKIEIYMAAAQVAGGEIKDLNSSGQEGTFSFSTSRTQFRKPLKSGVKGEMFFIYNRPFEADVSMTYDQEFKGSLLSANFKYAPTRNLNLRIGADIIGLENEDTGTSQTNFLEQSKANDRFTAGVSYVF